MTIKYLFGLKPLKFKTKSAICRQFVIKTKKRIKLDEDIQIWAVSFFKHKPSPFRSKEKAIAWMALQGNISIHVFR
jgi:hypothetical protein